MDSKPEPPSFELDLTKAQLSSAKHEIASLQAQVDRLKADKEKIQDKGAGRLPSLHLLKQNEALRKKVDELEALKEQGRSSKAADEGGEIAEELKKAQAAVHGLIMAKLYWTQERHVLHQKILHLTLASQSLFQANSSLSWQNTNLKAANIVLTARLNAIDAHTQLQARARAQEVETKGESLEGCGDNGLSRQVTRESMMSVSSGRERSLSGSSDGGILFTPRTDYDEVGEHSSQVGSLALDFKLAQDDSDYLEYGLTVPDRDDALTPIGGKIAAVTASVSDDKTPTKLKASRPSNGSQGRSQSNQDIPKIESPVLIGDYRPTSINVRRRRRSRSMDDGVDHVLGLGITGLNDEQKTGFSDEYLREEDTTDADQAVSGHGN